MATLSPKRCLDRTVVAAGLKETADEGRCATALALALATALTLALASAITKRHLETGSYGGRRGPTSPCPIPQDGNGVQPE